VLVAAMGKPSPYALATKAKGSRLKIIRYISIVTESI